MPKYCVLVLFKAKKIDLWLMTDWTNNDWFVQNIRDIHKETSPRECFRLITYLDLIIRFKKFPFIWSRAVEVEREALAQFTDEGTSVGSSKASVKRLRAAILIDVDLLHFWICNNQPPVLMKVQESSSNTAWCFCIYMTSQMSNPYDLEQNTEKPFNN